MTLNDTPIRILVQIDAVSSPCIQISQQFFTIEEFKEFLHEKLDRNLENYSILIRDDLFNEFRDFDDIKDLQNGSVFQLRSKCEMGSVSAGSGANLVSAIPPHYHSSPWPAAFPIPNLLDETKDAILATSMQNLIQNPNLKLELLNSFKGLKSHILTSVCQTILQFTEYPSKKQLEQVAEELILKYPILKNDKVQKGWEPWLMSLQDKMNNMRRSLKRQHVESVYVNSSARKQIRTCVNPVGISPNKNVVKARKGEVNFRPNHYPPGEDKESCVRHRDAIKQELCHTNPDIAKIRHLMNLTFTLRRHDITEPIVDQDNEQQRALLVHEIMSLWPALKLSSVALDEFHLLMTVNIEFQWYQRLDAISTKIIKRFEKVRSSHNENGSSLEQYFNLLDTENPTSFSRGKALVSISILLGEKISQFSRIFEDGTSTAALRTSDPMNGATIAVINSDKPRFFILAENEIVQDNLRTFEEAIMYVFVYHYILNLQFCAPYMLEFCQRAIVQAGWSDNHNSKISRRINSLIKILDL